MARAMKDSGIEWIGEIPEGWMVSKLQYFIDCYDGRRVPVDAVERTPGPYPYWGAGSIMDYVNDYLFDEELLLLGEDGAPFFDYTRPVAFYSNEKIWVNNHIHVLKPHADICIKYLLHYLNNVDYKSYINGSILNKLTQSNMNKIALLLPPVSEQQIIADYLDTECAKIDAVIEQTRASIEEYKKLKQSVITQAVTKGIRPGRKMKDSGVEWIDLIPETWKECRIKNVIFPVQRPVNDNDDIITCFRDGVVTLRKNRREDGFTVSFTENGYQGVEPGDLVIHGMDAFAGAIGCSDSRGKTTPVVHVCKTSGNNRYFMYYLRCMAYGNILMDLSNGVRIRSSDFRNFAKLGVFKAVVPPESEQAEIVEYLDWITVRIDELAHEKEHLLDELESYKKSLIYEYVTGKKEVPV